MVPAWLEGGTITPPSSSMLGLHEMVGRRAWWSEELLAGVIVLRGPRPSFLTT